MRFKVVAFLFVLFSINVYADAPIDGDTTAERPVDLYIHNSKTGKTEFFALTFRSSDLTAFTLEDENRKPICSGGLAAKRNWVFHRLTCPDKKLQIDEMVLAERFKFLVLRHALSMTTLKDGRNAGVFVHLANEGEYKSTARVSDEKVKDIYGEFPNWKIPQ